MEIDKNEVLTSESKLKSTKIHLPFIEGSLSVCKIHTFVYKGKFGNRDLSQYIGASGTGFFIKFKDNKFKNRYKYFIMTNEHVLQKEIIEKGTIYFTIYYFYEKYYKKILLNKKERFIKEYKTNLNLDITLIEVVPEQEISVIFFLEPDYKSLNGYQQYLNEEIIIHQYPVGLEQCNSEGKIVKIDNKLIVHNASTQGGSSGSPIILKNNSCVVGIHKSGSTMKENNGDFICDIITDINNQENIRSYEEKNKNENERNYTNSNVIVEKTDNFRKYQIHPYEITLNINKNNCIKLSITNINTKKFFYKNDLIFVDIEDELKIFDREIYNSKIIERDQYLEFVLGKDKKIELKIGPNDGIFNILNNYVTAEIQLSCFNYKIPYISIREEKQLKLNLKRSVIINPFEKYDLAFDIEKEETGMPKQLFCFT